MTLVPDGTVAGFTVTAVVVAILKAASAAPMVQRVSPCPGRATPRWSVLGQTVTPWSLVALGITLAAGLLVLGSMVWVGPPLLARCPRSGFLFTRSLTALKAQAVPVGSSVRL